MGRRASGTGLPQVFCYSNRKQTNTSRMCSRRTWPQNCRAFHSKSSGPGHCPGWQAQEVSVDLVVPFWPGEGGLPACSFLILSVGWSYQYLQLLFVLGLDKTCIVLGTLQPSCQPVLIINKAFKEALTCRVPGSIGTEQPGVGGGRL